MEVAAAVGREGSSPAALRDRRPTRAAPPIAGCSRPAGGPTRRRWGTPGCPKPPVDTALVIGRSRRGATHARARDLRVDGLDHRLLDREVEMVAAPGDRAVPHRDERGVRGHRRGDLERELSGRQQRRTAGESADREVARTARTPPRASLRTSRVRAGLAEWGDRHDHELRARASHVVDVEIRVSGLEPDVGVRQAARRPRRRSSDGGSLVRVARGVERVDTLTRSVDADDVGTKIGE